MSYLLRISQSTVYKDHNIKTPTSFCVDLTHTDSSMYKKQGSLNFCHKHYLTTAVVLGSTHSKTKVLDLK